MNTKTLRRNRILIALAMFVLLLSACSSDVEILSVTASGDGTRLELSLNSCNRTYDVSVEEADGVSVHVVDAKTESPVRLGGEDCGDVWTFTLAQPLDDRPLIDTATGREVPVTYDPWNQYLYSEDEYRDALAATVACIAEGDPEASASVAESEEGPCLVVDLPELGDGESGSNVAHDCEVEHLSPLRR
ncbi:MAG: hypothetical protein GY926_09695 [bacterium]|nr:hypothetical protein [bacterium]